MEFPWWVLVFDFGISTQAKKGCHTILLNFHGWKLVFSRISKGKVANLTFPGGFQKIISSTMFFFSGIAHYTYKIPRPVQCFRFALDGLMLNSIFKKSNIWVFYIKSHTSLNLAWLYLAMTTLISSNNGKLLSSPSG